jgi:hypothetical protein
MSKTPSVNDLLNSTALKESGFQYLLIVAITISSLVAELGWVGVIAICLSFLGIVFGGYVKKIAENKMASIIAANKAKDEEILTLKSQISDLKAIKQKLMDEIKLEVIKSFPSMEKSPEQKES